MAEVRTDELQRAIRGVIARLSPSRPAAVEPGQRLIDDLAYDSLALIELALALEDEFRLTPLSDYDSLDIVSVGEVEELVVGRIAAGAVRP